MAYNCDKCGAEHETVKDKPCSTCHQTKDIRDFRMRHGQFYYGTNDQMYYNDCRNCEKEKAKLKKRNYRV